MNVNNLIILIEVFVFYSVLVFGLSAFFLRPVLMGKSFTKKFLACFLAGNFYVMNVVFLLLLFFHCSNRVVTILVLILGAVTIRASFNLNKAETGVKGAWSRFQRLISGTYGWHLFFRRLRRSLYGNVREGLRFIFVKHQAEVGGLLFCLIVHGSYTGRRLVLYSGYGGYDEVVHTSWVQAMMGGEIYSDGVYPFGFHEMIYAVAKVFGMYAQQVLRDFGFVTVIYMAMMLYCLVAEVLENRLIAFATTFFYSVVCIYVQYAWDRFGFGYPQEFGLIFLYPMAIFLFYYLKNKDKFSLIFFGMAFSLTLYVHYYITIIALLLCFCIGVVYFVYMFKEKLLVPILVCGIVFSLIGASTMVLGVVTGHGLQGSLYWALELINGDEETEEVEDVQTTDETAGEGQMETTQTTDETAGEGQTQTAQTTDETAGEGQTETTQTTDETAGEGQTETTQTTDGTAEEIKEDTTPLSQKIKEKLILIGSSIKEYALINCVTENGFWGFLGLWIMTFVLAFCGLFAKPKRMQSLFCISFLFYILLLCILMSAAGIGLPVIIEDYRVRVFLCYALPFTIAVPIYFMWMLAEEVFLNGQSNRERWRSAFRRFGMIPISIFMLITLVEQNLIRQPSRSIVIQSNEIVDVFYQIIDEYDNYSWTLVSDVQEYAMCLNYGYHYEWTDLLKNLSNGTMTIKIPTKYVFFAIEKRPIEYGTVIETGDNIPVQGQVSREHAAEPIDMASVASTDKLYVQYRLQVMSKAYYWAEAYADLFPEEMKVYYEDDNVIYYCLTQEPYYLNNLKIDYKYNSLLGDQTEEEQWNALQEQKAQESDGQTNETEENNTEENNTQENDEQMNETREDDE